jgi:hypothetical protein
MFIEYICLHTYIHIYIYKPAFLLIRNFKNCTQPRFISKNVGCKRSKIICWFMSKVFLMSMQFKNAFKLNSNKKKVSSESCLVDATTCTASSKGDLKKYHSWNTLCILSLALQKESSCSLKVVLVHHILQSFLQRCNPCGCTLNSDQFVNKLSLSASTSCCTRTLKFLNK